MIHRMSVTPVRRSMGLWLMSMKQPDGASERQAEAADEDQKPHEKSLSSQPEARPEVALTVIQDEGKSLRQFVRSPYTYTHIIFIIMCNIYRIFVFLTFLN